MGYLVCEKCGRYYKLQKDELPDDFDICQCGGKLKYYKYISDYLGEEKPEKSFETSKKDLLLIMDTLKTDKKEKCINHLKRDENYRKWHSVNYKNEFTSKISENQKSTDNFEFEEFNKKRKTINGNGII